MNTNLNTGRNKMNDGKNEKIVLAHMPYWDPLVPPMGIATLKAYLEHFGYRVSTFDLNVHADFKASYKKYFEVFEKYIPERKRGNFYNIGHETLQNHLMAYINQTDESGYLELVKQLIDTIFFDDASEQQVLEHHDVIRGFYQKLEKYFVEIFDRENPSVIGITAFKSTLPAAMFTFRLAKERVPGIKTLMGGGIFADTMAIGSPNFDFFLEKSKDYIDKVMIGKGEEFFLKFLRNELPESQRVFTLKDFEGTPVEPAPNVLPDLSDMDLRHYPYVTASGSTSCPYKCSFCNSSIFYGEFKQKPVAQIVEYMSNMQDRYGSRTFFMTDALLNPIVTEFAEAIIQSERTFYYDAYFRVDEESCNVENTLLWRQGGFYRARLGVESGSQKILDLIGKGINVEQTKQTISGLAYAGIKPTAYIVIGHPGETEEDFQMTLDLLEEKQNDIWQAECIPFAYYYNGQPGGGQWKDKRKLLFSEKAKEMLIIRTWVVDEEPGREEVYNRVFRFSQHCRKLGIPNPYSFKEIYQADERWKILHKNAVPSLIELIDRDNVTHDRHAVKRLHFAHNRQRYDSDFGF